MFLKVSPRKGVSRFGAKGKLAPRFIGPFQITQRVGEVAYRLDLPPALSHVHNVFHVSMLRQSPHQTESVIPWNDISVREDTSYDDSPI